MSELFDDDEEKKILIDDEEVVDADEDLLDNRQRPSFDARRRLENMLEDKRLRDELEDFLDY